MPSVSLLLFSLKLLRHDLKLQTPVCLHPSHETLSLFSQLNSLNELQKNELNWKQKQITNWKQ